jgi:hypothetical protein
MFGKKYQNIPNSDPYCDPLGKNCALGMISFTKKFLHLPKGIIILSLFGGVRIKLFLLNGESGHTARKRAVEAHGKRAKKSVCCLIRPPPTARKCMHGPKVHDFFFLAMHAKKERLGKERRRY